MSLVTGRLADARAADVRLRQRSAAQRIAAAATAAAASRARTLLLRQATGAAGHAEIADEIQARHAGSGRQLVLCTLARISRLCEQGDITVAQKLDLKAMMLERGDAAARSALRPPQTCCICYEEVPATRAQVCAGPPRPRGEWGRRPSPAFTGQSRHYVCLDCLASWVRSLTFDDLATARAAGSSFDFAGLLQRRGCIPCPASATGTSGRCCQAWENHVVARALSAAGRLDVLARLFATAIYAAQCSKAVADADSTVLRAFAEAERNAALASKSAGDATGLSAKTMLRSASVEQRRAALKQAVPNARMCSKCGFGPLVNVNCDNMATHAHEANNACVRCGFFGSDWKEFPLWDGRLPEEHDAAQGRDAGADSAKMESTITTAPVVDLSPMCSWTTTSPALDDAITCPSGTLFVPTLDIDPSADRRVGWWRWTPYDCQIQVEGGDPRYWLNQSVQQHLYDRRSNPLCATGAHAGATLITETGLRFSARGRRDRHDNDTINGPSREDRARSFVRREVLATPDLLGVEDEVWLYVEPDLDARRPGRQTAANRSGRAGWIRAGVTAATGDGAEFPADAAVGGQRHVLAGSAVVPTFPASRAAVDADAVARFVTTRSAVLHASAPADFNSSSACIPVPAGTVLRSLAPFVKIIPADSDSVSARLSAIQASFGGHAGVWRDPTKRQDTDARLWCARCVCQHGPRIVAAPHWTCCGQTMLSCRCRTPLGARADQDLQAGTPVLVRCPECKAAEDKDLSAADFHNGGRGLDGSAEEIYPHFCWHRGHIARVLSAQNSAPRDERRCRVVWQRGSCPMDAESTGAVVMMLSDAVKPSLSRGDVDLLDRLMPAAREEERLLTSPQQEILNRVAQDCTAREESKAGGGDSGGRVVVFADAAGRAVCAIFPNAGCDGATTGEARRRGFLITAPCGVVRPLRLGEITVFVTSKQLLDAWWLASTRTQKSDDESETDYDSDDVEKSDRPPLRPLFRPLRVPATWDGFAALCRTSGVSAGRHAILCANLMKEAGEDDYALAPWNVGAGDLYNANTFALALHRLRDGARLCCSEHANPITASLRFSLTYAFGALRDAPRGGVGDVTTRDAGPWACAERIELRRFKLETVKIKRKKKGKRRKTTTATFSRLIGIAVVISEIDVTKRMSAQDRDLYNSAVRAPSLPPSWRPGDAAPHDAWKMWARGVSGKETAAGGVAKGGGGGGGGGSSKEETATPFESKSNSKSNAAATNGEPKGGCCPLCGEQDNLVEESEAEIGCCNDCLPRLFRRFVVRADDNWEEHLGSSDRVVTLAEMLRVFAGCAVIEASERGVRTKWPKSRHDWVKWDGLRPKYEEEEEE